MCSIEIMLQILGLDLLQDQRHAIRFSFTVLGSSSGCDSRWARRPLLLGGVSGRLGP